MAKCICCGRTLVHDEIALTKRIYNRNAKEFYCLTCLASKFEVEEKVLSEKIKEFKKMGCTLFTDGG